jgi:polyferredoxin
MSKARRPRKVIAPIRQVVQLGALAVTGEWLWVGAFRCPYGVPFVSCTHCPMRVCPGTWLQPWAIGFIAISSVIAGRVFCGWACPMGAIQDLLGRIPKLRALRLPRFGRADRWLKGLKYAMLGLTVVAFYVLNTRFAIPVRGHANWSLDAVRVSWLTYDPYQKARVVVLVAGVVLALALTRVWCRYLCPLGALLTIGNRIGLIRLSRDMDRCAGCGRYPRECRTYTTPGTADCVLCGDCIEGCPEGAIGFVPRYWRKPDHVTSAIEESPQET